MKGRIDNLALDHKKIYLFISEGDKNEWLKYGTGSGAGIRIRSKISKETYFSKDRGDLVRNIEWEVREVTEQEAQWLEDSIKAGSLTPFPEKPMINNIYQIF